jgi:hypothetical protein
VVFIKVKGVFKEVVAPTGGKTTAKSVAKTLFSKWKLIAASFAPIVAIYYYTQGTIGIKAPLSQTLLLVGFFTTLLLGCCGIAFACGGMFGTFKTAAGVVFAIVSGGLILYFFPSRAFLEHPTTDWKNPGIFLFCGFGLALVFAAYFWLIWNPINKWWNAYNKADVDDKADSANA